MRQSSRRWLTGAVLTLAVVAGGISVLSSHAQSPGSGTPSPGTFSTTKSGGPPVTGVGSPTQPPQPGLPAARPTGNEMQRQDGLIRLARSVPGDAKPIHFDADQITSWNEDGLTVFLLSGQVLIQQSVVQARFEQGVVWVDMKRYKATGILHVDIYAEGRVWVDASSKIQEGQRAVLSLETRGEFRVRAGKGKMLMQDRSGDPLVTRARALGVGPRKGAVQVPASGGLTAPAQSPPATPAAPANRPVGLGAPVTPTSIGGVRPISFEQPKSGQNGPASAAIQLAQATTPGPAESAIPDGPPDSVPPPLERLPGADPLPVPSGPRPTFPAPPSSGDPTPPANPDRPIMLPPAQPALPIAPRSEATAPPVPGALPPRPSSALPIGYRVLPRGGKAPNISSEVLPGGKRIYTVTGGLILHVSNVPKLGGLDVEADSAVIYTTSSQDSDKAGQNLQGAGGETSSELEFYLAGHVILRSALNATDRVKIEADELFYDTKRNVAIALQTRLELKTTRRTQAGPLINEPVLITAPRLLQTGATTYEVSEAEIFSSKLPSDPGLKLLVAEATVTSSTRQDTNIFGQPKRDSKGQPIIVPENIIVARNVVSELEGIPFFYTPYLRTDINDPMGPLQSISLGENNIFGFYGGVALDTYKLLGLQPVAGTSSRLLIDYLSRRGPAVGTNFDYVEVLKSLTHNVGGDEVIPRYNGTVRLYGINDAGTDILGGNRPYNTFQPTELRGRALWRQSVWDLPYGFDVVNQVSLLSDRNFLEQYFKREFDTEPNQATFLYVKQQQDDWSWSALGQVQTSKWITTTQWLPRLDGALIGQPFFDRFTTNTRIGAAYANLRPSNDPTQPLTTTIGPVGPPLPLDLTTRNNSTGRFSILEEIAMPLDLGAFKVVPYFKGALVEYTNDLAGSENTRAWGAIGTRASLPLTHLYADAQSDLFNVQGLNHKMVFTGNWMYARANESYTKVPQLDRLNDDATESMLREFKHQEPLYNPGAGLALATSPLFDPQQYAIRRLLLNRLDTLDDIQVVQLDLRQRLQTKRGFPGAEHIVDWMTLDTSVSLFPQTKQNFGESFSFAEYQYTWNIGDRTTFESTGWFDPQDQGARVFTAGMYFNRPDRTSFYVGYRQIDPLQSRVVTGSVTYNFSPKYSMTASSAYDFGTSAALTESMIFTRIGTDLQVSLGFSYNSLQNNFGAIVQIIPTLIPLRVGGNLIQR